MPKASQAVISNYRGAILSGIPESAIPGVLVRLATVAVKLGRMPHQRGKTSATYEQLEQFLEQLGLLEEIKQL